MNERDDEPIDDDILRPATRDGSWVEMELPETEGWVDLSDIAAAQRKELAGEDTITLRSNQLRKLLADSRYEPKPPRIEPPSSSTQNIEPAPISESTDAPIVYEAVVRNDSSTPFDWVRVEHPLPSGPQFVEAEPWPSLEGGRLIWELGSMEPGTERRLRVQLQPRSLFDLAGETAAVFEVYQRRRVTTTISRPMAVNEPMPAAAESYLVFVLGGVGFAIPTSAVVQIQRLTDGHEIPEQITVDQSTFALFDPTELLGLTGATKRYRPRALLVRAQGRTQALLVDRTIGVRYLPIRSPIITTDGINRPFAAGFAELAGRLVTVLDLERLLTVIQPPQVDSQS